MLAEILNFQGAKPILSMGSLSKILNPHGKVTRGMAAVILQRFMERYKDYLLNGFKDLL